MAFTACDNQWDTVDCPSALPNANLDSLTSSRTRCGAKRPLFEDGTIVTKETHDSDSDSASDDEDDGEEYLEEDYPSEISSFGTAGGVPTEVKVSFHEHDNDDDSDSESSDAESEEETVDAEESEEEDNDHDSADEYETDEDNVDSEPADDEDLMDDSSCSSPPGADSQHDLFLPWDVSPSVQSLKYDEDDDDSSDEEEDGTYCYQRTYMVGSRRSGRPRMWDGCPSSISVSSSSSIGSSQGSKSSKCGSDNSNKTGVSFSDSVTVYPVFETAAYPPSVVENMYTGRDELRANKLRNKREFAYDLHDWRNATEEEDMEPNDEGDLVHPVHCAEKREPAALTTQSCRVQTYSSTLGGYTIGSVDTVHRAKRMRMYYP